jgi:hypothetical protein
MSMKSSAFRDMLSSPVKVDRRFGGTYLLHFQYQGVSQARKRREAGRKQSQSPNWYVLPKLWQISPNYMALQPRR